MKKAIVESITNYEINYNGELVKGYDKIDEFKNDVMQVISEKLTLMEIIEYYKSEAISSNDTNSTKEQRKELSELVLELEGFELWEESLKNPNFQW